MKAQYILILSLLVLVAHHICSQTVSQNYIRSRTFTNATGSTYLDNIQYVDGLGRPLQSVEKGATPLGADLVTYQEYDAFGRESNVWLPVVAPANNGAFMSLSNVTAKAATTYVGESKPYSKPVYEASPLNRIVLQYGPGQEWQNYNKATSTGYITNVAKSGVALTLGDSLVCGLYVTTNDGKAVSIYQSGNYIASNLFVNRLKDEEGHTSYEFKDKLGQVVLTRQISENKLHDTYYVYDSFGNLRCVLPPLAAESLKNTSITSPATDTNNVLLQQYVYLYKYDSRNRCIAKKLPGADWIYYVYDKADRLIYTQEGEQRVKQTWTFSIPDALGRTVLRGICKNSMDYSINPLGSIVVGATRTNTTNAYMGYAITGITLSAPTVLSANYYDDYAFMGFNSIPAATDPHLNYETVTGYGAQYTGGYKGLLTGTLTAQLPSDETVSLTYLYSVAYYDNRGRLIQSKSNNHLVGGLEKEYICYNFTGQPIKKKHVHAATGQTTQTEVYSYEYDHAGRMKTTTHQLNSGSVVMLAANTYDELGRLASTKVSNQPNLQKTHTYNIRSWIDGISNPHFTEKLAYSYSGNIKTQQWQQVGKTKAYTFVYDGLSRLKSATYAGDGVYGTSYAYDKHGNITNLTRWGNTGTSTSGTIDNLTLTYNGNQLLKVEDTATTPWLATSADFNNGTTAATEYFYDANGNMKKDLNKGIRYIGYNSLNLPQSIVISNSLYSNVNSYIYSAAGVKLCARRGGFKTDYVGSAIYENGVFKRLLVDGGYIEGGVYHFYITDHLGNNRVVAKQDGTVVQSTQYYPFGMAFADGVGQSNQPYKYNGKELDGERGLNLYDYSARYMEPALGRFTTMDPMAEKYYAISPYAYVANNPMKFVDTDGKQIIIPPTAIPITPYPIVPPPIGIGSRQYPSAGEMLFDGMVGIYNFAKESLSLTRFVYNSLPILLPAVTPEYKHQERREKRAKEELDRNQANVAKSISANTPDPNWENRGGPKKKLEPWQKNVLVVVGVSRFILELSNPDPSKDSYEAHQAKVAEKTKEQAKQQEQQQGLMYRFVDWLKK